MGSGSKLEGTIKKVLVLCPKSRIFDPQAAIPISCVLMISDFI
jgi:hypothetical protein